MSLQRMYGAVQSTLGGVDFAALHPGFRQYTFALYTPEMVCLNGSMLPWDAHFCANTAIKYGGETIAIWNVTDGDNSDADILAYNMVHEMFHCFQEEQGETRYCNDLRLLGYPADLTNYMRKHQESQYLADAYVQGSIASLHRFCEIRNARLAARREYVLEELRAETIEGMAEFVALKALRQIDRDKYTRSVAEVLARLRKGAPLLFDVRRMAYDTGAAFALTLEKLGLPLHNAFSQATVYEQSLPVSASNGEVREEPAIRQHYQEWMMQKRGRIADGMADCRYVDYPSVICGYDPMNMLRVDDFVLCTRFAVLQSKIGSIHLKGPVVLRLAANSDQRVQGYYAV